jgi:preprotein translocase subunit SecB
MAPKYYLDDIISNMPTVSKIRQYLNLKNIYLLEAKIESDPTTRSPKGAKLDHKYGSEIISEENNNFDVKCNFLIIANRKEVPDINLLKIEASFVLEYYYEDNLRLKHEDIVNFVKIYPLYMAWPYWRELVQNLTSRMGFPALTISLVKIEMTKAKDYKQKSAKSKTLKKRSPITKAK